jgi:hypothetical protein
MAANPFAPAPKLAQTPLVSEGDIYDPLLSRSQTIVNDPRILEAIEKLRTRLGGKT